MKLFKRKEEAEAKKIKVDKETYRMLREAVLHAMTTTEMASNCMQECEKFVRAEVKEGRITTSDAIKYTSGMSYEILALNRCHYLAKEAWEKS